MRNGAPPHVHFADPTPLNRTHAFLQMPVGRTVFPALLSRYFAVKPRYSAWIASFCAGHGGECSGMGAAISKASALSETTQGLACWSLRLFGGFELGALPRGERVVLPGKRERILLAHLALSPNYRQSRRKLAALLWDDATDETLLDNLRACVWKLRKTLGDTDHRLIVSDGDDIALDAGAFDVDVWMFCHLIRSGELEVAANLYAGALLDGVDIDSERYEAWRRTEASRYRDHASGVLDQLMTQFAGRGDTEQAIEAGLRILQLEPLHEAAVRKLMRLYAENGRRDSAIQLYRTLADELKTELDAQPEPATRAMLTEIAHSGEGQRVNAALPTAVTPGDRPAPSSPIVPFYDSSLERPVTQPSLQPSARLAAVSPIGRPWRWKTRSLRRPVAGAFAAIVLFLLYHFIPSVTAQFQPAAPAASPKASISVAVLPFVNLSSDKEQEFFSDGMTEEITAALAKVPDLRVVARTSAFEFKGKSVNAKTLGDQLGATHLIEGSVRKDGNRLRITAQLIRAGDGTQLWAEDYQRELTDVFAIQEDIAHAIAASLRVPLGLTHSPDVIANRSISPESYEQFLRAKALVRTRGPKSLTEAVGLLEQVVAHNAEYAPAWALLGQAYAVLPDYMPAYFIADASALRPLVQGSLPKAESAARRALELDPRNAQGYLALALAAAMQFRWVAAEDLYSRALALDPNDPDALHHYSNMVAAVGRVTEALALRRKLQALEPFVPVFSADTADIMWLNGEDQAAIGILRNLHHGFKLSRIDAAAGRFRQATDDLISMQAGLPPELADNTIRVLRTAPRAAPPADATLNLGVFSFAYEYAGAPERALLHQEANAEAGYLDTYNIFVLWHPSYHSLRKTKRFKALARKLGLVEYWRAKGWPPQCRSTTGDDFECD